MPWNERQFMDDMSNISTLLESASREHFCLTRLGLGKKEQIQYEQLLVSGVDDLVCFLSAAARTAKRLSERIKRDKKDDRRKK